MGLKNSSALSRRSIALLITICVGVSAGLGYYFISGDNISGDTASVGELVSSDLKREENPSVSQEKLSKLVENNGEFAFDLYHQLENKKGNLFYSPYSISTALAMTYAGSRGETAQQMADTLRFDLPQNQLHPAFNALEQKLTGRENLTLNPANSLWGQENWTFKEDFLDTLARNYGAGMHRLNFQKNLEQARQAINSWVKNRTENTIKGMIPPGVFKEAPPTALVLVNTLYFKATWSNQFKKDDTSESSFTLLNGEEVKVPMMSMHCWPFQVIGENNYKAVELPYHGDMSMLVLLPDEGSFQEFESNLDYGLVEEIVENLERQTLSTLSIPKFGFDSEFKLSDTLENMGMIKPFYPNADFSGMTSTPVWIEQVRHKAHISVNEKGTEATASTSSMMVSGLGSEIHIDHPFIFLIRDDKTGAILFVGRVLNPNK